MSPEHRPGAGRQSFLDPGDPGVFAGHGPAFRRGSGHRAAHDWAWVVLLCPGWRTCNAACFSFCLTRCTLSTMLALITMPASSPVCVTNHLNPGSTQ